MRYEIKGKVVDQKTHAGVAGLRVEAYGTDLDLEGDLGYTATLSDGSFAAFQLGHCPAGGTPVLRRDARQIDSTLSLTAV